LALRAVMFSATGCIPVRVPSGRRRASDSKPESWSDPGASSAASTSSSVEAARSPANRQPPLHERRPRRRSGARCRSSGPRHGANRTNGRPHVRYSRGTSRAAAGQTVRSRGTVRDAACTRRESADVGAGSTDLSAGAVSPSRGPACQSVNRFSRTITAADQSQRRTSANDVPPRSRRAWSVTTNRSRAIAGACLATGEKNGVPTKRFRVTTVKSHVTTATWRATIATWRVAPRPSRVAVGK
jgi:hypothetical protein